MAALANSGSALLPLLLVSPCWATVLFSGFLGPDSLTSAGCLQLSSSLTHPCICCRHTHPFAFCQVTVVGQPAVPSFVLVLASSRWGKRCDFYPGPSGDLRAHTPRSDSKCGPIAASQNSRGRRAPAAQMERRRSSDVRITYSVPGTGLGVDVPT